MCADNSIEDKIKTCPAHGCRVCKHFIRVNYDGIENVSHRQGFCILGGLEGDYSLYVSKTAKDCCGYIFSESHEKITIAETDLSKQMSEFEHRCEDKRTSDYKQIEPMFEETRKYIQSMGHKGFAAIAAMREVCITANRYYREKNKDDFLRVYNMVNLKKSDYLKFVARVAVKVHDEFCDCDNLVYTGGD